MAKDNFYFYISGLISLSFFALVTLTFFYMLFNNTDIKSYAFEKKDFISVSIKTVDVVKPKASKPISSAPKDITVPEQLNENVNIDELFSDVWTKDIKNQKQKKQEPKIDSKRYNEIARKVKASKENKVESFSEKISKITNSKDSSENEQTSSADEVNEYLAKIQATIYNHFNPPSNTQGKSAQVVIEFSAIGKMIDFRILRYSDSDSFNEEIRRVKERLKSVVFPKNPNNMNYTLTTNIISKE
jgi:protein TonB